MNTKKQNFIIIFFPLPGIACKLVSYSPLQLRRMPIFRNRINHERTRYHSARKIAESKIDKMKETKEPKGNNKIAVFAASQAYKHVSNFLSRNFLPLFLEPDFIYKNKQPSFYAGENENFLLPGISFSSPRRVITRLMIFSIHFSSPTDTANKRPLTAFIISRVERERERESRESKIGHVPSRVNPFGSKIWFVFGLFSRLPLPSMILSRFPLAFCLHEFGLSVTEPRHFHQIAGVSTHGSILFPVLES